MGLALNIGALAGGAGLMYYASVAKDETTKAAARIGGIGLVALGVILTLKDSFGFSLTPNTGGVKETLEIPPGKDILQPPADSSDDPAIIIDDSLPGQSGGGIQLGGPLLVEGRWISPQQGNNVSRGVFSDAYPVEIEIHNKTGKTIDVYVEIEANLEWHDGTTATKVDAFGSYSLAAGEVRRLTGFGSTGDTNFGIFEGIYGISASAFIKINNYLVAGTTFGIN